MAVHVVQRWSHATCAASFHAWLATTRHRERVQRRLAAGLARWRCRTRATAWESWAVYVRRGQHVQRAGRLMLRRTLRLAWLQFVDGVETRREQRAAVRLVLVRVQRRALALAWNTFVGALVQLMSHHGAINKAISFWRTPGLESAWDLWLECIAASRWESMAAAKQQLSLDLERAQSSVDDSRNALSLSVSAEKARRIMQAQRIVRRMLHAQLASAFDSFHSRVIETRDKKKACQRVILRMQHVALAGAWEMFTGTVAQMRAHQQVVARAMSRWRTPSVRMGFELWLEYTEERKLGALGAEKLQVMHNLDCVDVYVCG